MSDVGFEARKTTKVPVPPKYPKMMAHILFILGIKVVILGAVEVQVLVGSCDTILFKAPKFIVLVQSPKPTTW